MKSFCCVNNDTRVTVEARLVFKRDQLLYDIANAAYVEGHIMGEGDECRRHTTIDIAQQGNVDRVTRVLDVAVSGVREALYPYTKEPVTLPSEKTDELQEPGEYSIDMQVPVQQFSVTTLDYLEKLIHEYLVAVAVCDWLGTTKAEAVPHWQRKSEALMKELRSAAASRTGRTRRKCSPF